MSEVPGQYARSSVVASVSVSPGRTVANESSVATSVSAVSHSHQASDAPGKSTSMLQGSSHQTSAWSVSRSKVTTSWPPVPENLADTRLGATPADSSHSPDVSSHSM